MSTQWNYMTRSNQVLWTIVDVSEYAKGVGPIGRADSGCDTFGRIHGNGVLRAVAILIVVCHQWKI
jgi:hypothetical protein